LSEKKELIPPSSPGLSEKIKEPDHHIGKVDWQHASPVATAASPSASLTALSHRTLSKPPPIEVPAHPNVEEERPPVQVEPRTSDLDHKSAVPPSPAVSETSITIIPAPQASDASLPIPKMPPRLDISAGDDPAHVTMEHLALLNSAHRGDTAEATFKHDDTHSSSGFSASNGELHQPIDQDTPSLNGSISASSTTCGSFKQLRPFKYFE
jgi:hypothetical protein